MEQEYLDSNHMINLDWTGDLTIRRIDELKVQIEAALAAAAKITVTVAVDAEIDMSLLQLLCAAHRTAVREGKTLVLATEIPEQLKMLMEIAGFSRHIGCARDQSDSCLWKTIHLQLVEKESI